MLLITEGDDFFFFKYFIGQQRRQWQATPVLLPRKSHGWRSLVGCSPWGRYESDATERLHFQFSLSRNGEGNGDPLQCSCLENPRDGRARWAAIYGVTQSWTWLKRLSSSSSSRGVISVYTCSDYQGPLSWWSGHYFSHKLMGLKSLLKSGNLARGLKLLLGVIILSFLIIHSFFLWIYIFSSSTLIGCPSIFPLCNFILLAISTAFYRSGQAPLWLSLWDCLLLW